MPTTSKPILITRAAPVTWAADSSLSSRRAYFRPSPFWGRLYWYACFPLHWFVFQGMARSLVRAAEREARPQPATIQPR